MPYPAHPGPWPGPPLGRTARLVVPAVLAFVAQVPFAVWQATHFLPRALGAITVLLAVAGPVLLLYSRRSPGPVVAAIAAITAFGTLVESPVPFGPPPLALAFAVVLAVARGAARWALVSVAAAWVAVLLATVVGAVAWSPPRLLGATVLLLVALGAGEFLRARRARRTEEEHAAAERRREAEQRQQTAEQAERVRIARELHDVLAHSLSSIAVQAGVGLHLMDSDPERARAALAAIRSASTAALDEVRSVIGALRSDAPLRPDPGVAGVAELVPTAEAAGVQVDLRLEAGPDLPSALQLAVYRIVQEALTNVVRHAHATRALVRVAEEEDSVLIEVVDDGRGTAPDPSEGRGLLGMRERAELLGGYLSVGAGPSGGFAVRAVLPKGGAQ